MLCSDFSSDLYFLSYEFLTWIRRHGLSLQNLAVWIRDLCNVLRLEKLFRNWYWYSLMWFAWIHMLLLVGSVYILSILPWLRLPCIMNYLLCMTHYFATANHYDHAWTAKWAQNICKLSMLMSPLQLRCDGRQHGRRGRLYATKVKWKVYPTSCALLDVGFMFILRRTDIFILIWACTAVLPN